MEYNPSSIVKVQIAVLTQVDYPSCLFVFPQYHLTTGSSPLIGSHPHTVAVFGGLCNLCWTTAKLIKAFLSFKSFTLRGALLLTGSMPWVSLAFDLVIKPVPPNVTHPNSIFYEST
ncbi:hypothetical protein [Anabaenopsis arnoldii]|uniref:hypothetical protein n=1 Tax=Anabaenopsis arnoldii TaxID=2152938 RepID=UPI00232C58D5|nr:hypothetical protein [Anabaenopsis arnoldii]MDH6093182.1 hypothetical protein [Anabaenopsis arnoldii]